MRLARTSSVWSLAAGACVVLAALSGCSEESAAASEDAASTIAAATPLASDPVAACEAFRSGGTGAEDDEEVATADKDAVIAAHEIGEETGIRLIGLGRCEDSWVVSVGVDPDTYTSGLPVTAPQGTPVLIYAQMPFTAQ